MDSESELTAVSDGQANYRVGAVRVGAGASDVGFSYAPAAIARGAVLTFTAVLLCLLIILYDVRHRGVRAFVPDTAADRGEGKRRNEA